MPAQNLSPSPNGFDIAAIGTLVVLRAPSGEIIHFDPKEAIEVAQRLVDCAIDCGVSTGRPG